MMLMIDHSFPNSVALLFQGNSEIKDDGKFLDLANFMYFVTGFFTAALAVIAYFNFQQFNLTSKSSYLLEIDKRWGSLEIIKARQIIHVLYRNVCDEVGYEDIRITPKLEVEKVVYPKVAKLIVELSVSEKVVERRAFIYLLNYLELMESLGYLYKDNKDKIDELQAFCGETLVFNYGVFYSYIMYKENKHRKEEQGVQNNDIRFYKEFRNLIKEMRKERKEEKKISTIEDNQREFNEPYQPCKYLKNKRLKNSRVKCIKDFFDKETRQELKEIVD